MDQGLYAGIITMLGTILVALIGLIGIRIKDRIDDSNKVHEEQQRLNRDYLNPLRFFLEETYFRMKEIYDASTYVCKVLIEKDEEAKNKQEFQIASERCKVLFFTGDTDDISNQSDTWFIGEGAYLISSTYIIACLFLYIKKLKEDLPYVRLNYKKGGVRNRFLSWSKQIFRGKDYTQDDDTILLNLVHEVSRAFLHDNGVYYALQPTIGHKMYLSDQKRFITLEEFAHTMQIAEQRIWFDRLFKFFIEASGNQYFNILTSDDQSTPNLDQLEKKYTTRLKSIAWAVNAVGLVSIFLDKSVGGGPSIQKRLLGESHSIRHASNVMTMTELENILEGQLKKQREQMQKLSKVKTF